MSDQAIFTLKDLGINDDEVKKTNVSDLLTVFQRRLGHFLSFMMTFHPYQADSNCKNSYMTCRDCVKLPFDVDGIDTSIDAKILKITHYLLVHLAALGNGRKPDIGTLKKDRGDIISECCAKPLRKQIYIM